MVRATPTNKTGGQGLRKGMEALTSAVDEAANKPRPVRFPNPGSALRQHVAAATPPAPVRIPVRPPVVATEAATRPRDIVRQLQAEQTGARDAVRTAAAHGALAAARDLQALGAAFDSPSALGAQVRTLRRAKELSQDRLAALAGVGRRFIIDLEGGKPTVELGLTLRVLQALGCSLCIDATGHG